MAWLPAPYASCVGCHMARRCPVCLAALRDQDERAMAIGIASLEDVQRNWRWVTGWEYPVGADWTPNEGPLP